MCKIEIAIFKNAFDWLFDLLTIVIKKGSYIILNCLTMILEINSEYI